MDILGTGAAILDINFQIGSYRVITFDFGIDLSTWTFEFVLKKNKGDRVKILSLTLGSGISFPIYQSTQIDVTFSVANTSIEEGEYYYELRRTDVVLPIINGLANFSFEAKQGTSETNTLQVNVLSQTISVTVSNNNPLTLAQLGALQQTAATDTPLDADTFNFYDVVDVILKKITWANIKATLKTYFDTIYTALSNTSVALTDAATIDVTAIKHTLTTASSRTFTVSFTGDTFGIAITLNATSATFTLPAGHKGIYNGTPSGTNTLVIIGATSGDVILVEAKRYSSVYYWVGRNAIR